MAKGIKNTRSTENNILLTNTLNQLKRVIRNNISRSRTSGGITQHGGKRDIYNQVGYPITIEFPAYMARFERELGVRIVNSEPKESFVTTPRVTELKGKDNTFFVKDWNNLTEANTTTNSKNFSANSRLEFWSSLLQSDIQSGIGAYGALLIGVNDGKKLSEPITRNSVQNVTGLKFLTPLNEAEVTWEDKDIEKNQTSPNWGRPSKYKLINSSNKNAGAISGNNIDVNWTRIIHITENGRLKHMPRMMPVYNELENILKISAGSGEGAWQSVARSIIQELDIAQIQQLEGNKPLQNSQRKALQDFVLDLNKIISAPGKLNIIEGKIVDPSGALDAHLGLIATILGWPKRILMGSERGELSSSQDEKRWKRGIQQRRLNYINPIILAPLIERLIFFGVLRSPKQGFEIHWTNVDKNEIEQDVKILDRKATAIKRLADSITQLNIVLDDDKKNKLEEMIFELLETKT